MKEGFYIRKLTKVGKFSYAITLPIRVIRKFGWRERQRLLLKVYKTKEKILIQDYEP